MEPNSTGAENPSPDNGGNSAQPDFARLASAIASGAGGNVPGVASSQFPPKRGPGRPKTHGRYSRAAGSDGKSRATMPPVDGEPVPGSGPAPLPADGGDGFDAPSQPRLVRLPTSLIARLAKIPWAKLDQFGRRWLAEKASRIPADLRSEADKLIEATGFSAEELELLCEITPLVLEEWEIGGGEFFTPTTALAILIAFKALDVVSAGRTLERLAERKP